MANTPTSPANREFCVWAECRRGVYQHVEAASPEAAYRLAGENPDGWEFCFEDGAAGYRLSNGVQDVASQEYVTVGPVEQCRTCGSEIVETVNDSHSRDGECGHCEYLRYKARPDPAAARVGRTG